MSVSAFNIVFVLNKEGSIKLLIFPVLVDIFPVLVDIFPVLVDILPVLVDIFPVFVAILLVFVNIFPVFVVISSVLSDILLVFITIKSVLVEISFALVEISFALVEISFALISTNPLNVQYSHQLLSKLISFTPFEYINDIKNSMLFTIERPGKNIKGICHTMDGQKITHSILPIESEIQKNPPNAWIAIGDGGNELGTGYYRNSIEKVIPDGKCCNCGCEGGITAFEKADRCILSTTSNFGAISLSLELARQKNINWNVPANKVTQIIKILNKYGIKDGVTGEEGTVDGISIELRKKMYEQLNSLF